MELIGTPDPPRRSYRGPTTNSVGKFYQSLGKTKNEEEKRLNRRASIYGSMQRALGIPSLEDDVFALSDNHSSSHSERNIRRYPRRGSVDAFARTIPVDGRQQPSGYRTLEGQSLAKKQHSLAYIAVKADCSSPGITTDTASTANTPTSLPSATSRSDRCAAVLSPSTIAPPISFIDERPVPHLVRATTSSRKGEKEHEAAVLGAATVEDDDRSLPGVGGHHSVSSPSTSQIGRGGKELASPPRSSAGTSHRPPNGSSIRNTSKDENSGGRTLRNLARGATPKQASKKTLKVFADQLKRISDHNRSQNHVTQSRSGGSATVDDRPIPYSSKHSTAKSHSDVDYDNEGYEDDDMNSVFSFADDYQYQPARPSPLALGASSSHSRGRSSPRSLAGTAQRRRSMTKYSLDEPSSSTPAPYCAPSASSIGLPPKSPSWRGSSRMPISDRQLSWHAAVDVAPTPSGGFSSSSPTIRKSSIAQTLLTQKKSPSPKLGATSTPTESRNEEDCGTANTSPSTNEDRRKLRRTKKMNTDSPLPTKVPLCT